MILSLVVDGGGTPICAGMRPGNTAGVTTLLPVVERMRGRFGSDRVCVVADHGMISAQANTALDTQLKKDGKALTGSSAYRRFLRKSREVKASPGKLAGGGTLWRHLCLAQQCKAYPAPGGGAAPPSASGQEPFPENQGPDAHPANFPLL